jgi:N-acetylglucosaminyldiphosphoundecaprenol N-acetyl-beta-D-mannosaminyltransferase
MPHDMRGREDASEPAVPLAGAARRLFLDVPIDCLTMAETIAAADRAITSQRKLQHVCVNVAKLVAMRRNPELDRDVRASDIISVDGMGIVWGARLFGVDVPERVTGVDVMEGMLLLCADRGYRPYFLGARPEVLERAVANTQARHPALVFAGRRDGYYRPEEEAAIVAEIDAAAADCLFIGMPTPRKERFLARHRAALRVPFIMGVGGGLDVLAGHVRRAPALIQKLGLEWLYRAVQEPLRLGPRYAKTNIAFAAILAQAWWNGNRPGAKRLPR